MQPRTMQTPDKLRRAKVLTELIYLGNKRVISAQQISVCHSGRMVSSLHPDICSRSVNLEERLLTVINSCGHCQQKLDALHHQGRGAKPDLRHPKHSAKHVQKIPPRGHMGLRVTHSWSSHFIIPQAAAPRLPKLHLPAGFGLYCR